MQVRRYDRKVNPKGILRLMCEDNLLACGVRPVIMDPHRGGGSAGRWIAKERLIKTPFREKLIGTDGSHDTASDLAM